MNGVGFVIILPTMRTYGFYIGFFIVISRSGYFLNLDYAVFSLLIIRFI